MIAHSWRGASQKSRSRFSLSLCRTHTDAKRMSSPDQASSRRMALETALRVAQAFSGKDVTGPRSSDIRVRPRCFQQGSATGPRSNERDDAASRRQRSCARNCEKPNEPRASESRSWYAVAASRGRQRGIETRCDERDRRVGRTRGSSSLRPSEARENPAAVGVRPDARPLRGGRFSFGRCTKIKRRLRTLLTRCGARTDSRASPLPVGKPH